MTTSKTNAKAVPTTTSKVVTLDSDKLEAIFESQDTEWFVTKRAEVEEYIDSLQEIAGELRKNFDRLLQMAKSDGFAAEVQPLRKPREGKADPANRFGFVKF